MSANLPTTSNPMNPEQLDALLLAVKVVFTGPAGTYNLDDLAKLRRASGLQKYIHECAQAAIVDATGCTWRGPSVLIR